MGWCEDQWLHTSNNAHNATRNHVDDIHYAITNTGENSCAVPNVQPDFVASFVEEYHSPEIHEQTTLREENTPLSTMHLAHASHS